MGAQGQYLRAYALLRCLWKAYHMDLEEWGIMGSPQVLLFIGQVPTDMAV
jgi:hypothetical protein